MIVDVKEMLHEEEEKLICKIKNNNLKMKLAVVVANDLDSSKSYILSKKKKAEKLGIIQEEYRFSKDVKEEEIIAKINELNTDESVNGILVQLPLYSHLNEDRVIQTVDIEKDVDGFSYEHMGKIMCNNEETIPCTPKGILLILDKLNVDIMGKSVVILGRSKIVGRPTAELLISRGATVTVCNSNTKNIIKYTKEADILIVAIGKPLYIKKDMIKENSIVIDVGINLKDNKIVGDVNTSDVESKAKYVTPVPGGIGLTTVFSLMDNLTLLAIKQKNKGGICNE